MKFELFFQILSLLLMFINFYINTCTVKYMKPILIMSQACVGDACKCIKKKKLCIYVISYHFMLKLSKKYLNYFVKLKAVQNKTFFFQSFVRI